MSAIGDFLERIILALVVAEVASVAITGIAGGEVGAAAWPTGRSSWSAYLSARRRTGRGIDPMTGARQGVRSRRACAVSLRPTGAAAG